ncbi:GFA family protein [Balneatrix alpica]|uniref:GFA family protein n=1 Tax=Balneatrix alpica TaxID=75684 RepID=A0ABV5ZDK1_9GAMM|nr:GFA family protein [Balneatrix alpica]
MSTAEMNATGSSSLSPLLGRCSCGEVRYQLLAHPLVVHACHCSWCQRESGSAFALNAMIESDEVKLLAGKPELHTLPSASGKGQQVLRCPSCKVVLWSHYGGAGVLISFVRVGTLEQPERLPPDVHIYTSTKLPWLPLPQGVLAMEEYYQRSKIWSAASLARFERIKAQLKG